MKKFFVFLTIMMILVSAVFASERITVKSSVEEKNPAFKLKAGLVSGTYGTTGKSVTSDEGSFNGEVLSAGVPSIADSDVVVFFQIIQAGSAGTEENPSATFARYKNIVTFDVAVGALTTTQQDGTNYEVKGTASKGTAVGANSDNKIKNDVVSDIKYTATYNGKVYDDQPIATFQVEWTKDPYAPNGTYSADVTLTITY